MLRFSVSVHKDKNIVCQNRYAYDILEHGKDTRSGNLLSIALLLHTDRLFPVKFNAKACPFTIEDSDERAWSHGK